jgi:uncharacterized membrane protein YfcA
MNLSPETISIIMLGGLLCGFLNTVASSGSAVSLPILMSIGLHASVANATNRIPVLIGAMAATFELARNKAIPWKRGFTVCIPVTLGATVGSWLSDILPSHDLRPVIVGAVLVALVLVMTKLKALVSSDPDGEVRLGWMQMFLFLLVGAWAGFIVLDSATYLLLVLVLAVRLPLIDANAIKNLVLVTISVVSIAVFAKHGSVDWRIGGVMALGSVAGGYIGARLAVSDQARRWIVGLLAAVIIAELIHLSTPYW